MKSRTPAQSSPPTPAVVPASVETPTTQLHRLSALAKGLDPQVLELALRARRCAVAANVLQVAPPRLAVIDYTLPSTQQRLWVFDLPTTTLLYAEYVAHGKGSGENFANRFSNRADSLQSSLGLFVAAETYDGENGYSLRMDGLEPGINDHARDRLLVMHGAPYVDPEQAMRQGRLGRSWGCPALRPQVARPLIDCLKQGQALVFAYYTDRTWLATSRFLHCDAGDLPSAGSQSRR